MAACIRALGFAAVVMIILSIANEVSGAVFTVANKCAYTVWPGVLTGSGPVLAEGGFTLEPGKSFAMTATGNWSGRQLYRAPVPAQPATAESLVDGYNVPLSISAVGGSGDCKTAGCTSDLNTKCPSELSVSSNGQVIACKSACAAFSTPQYCCTGDHGSPQTCPPTQYSHIFKAACPAAYSYAYDDPTSTFTCAKADYTITFCPTG
eukprot:Gb_25713 [translate_table: standard]